MVENLGATGGETQERVRAIAPAPAALPSAALRVPTTLPSPLPADIGFLVRFGFSPVTLQVFAAEAKACGQPAARLMVGRGLINQALYSRFLASHLGIADAGALTIDPQVVLADALRQGWFRAQTGTGDRVLVLSSFSPVVRVLLEGSLADQKQHLRLMDEHRFTESLRESFAAAIALQAATSVPLAESARAGLSRGQWLAVGLLLIVLIAGLALRPAETILLGPMLLGLVFLASTGLQLLTSLAGAPRQAPVAEAETAGLPVYSVLVPLYREAGVVQGLVEALSKLAYPPEKLDCLLVVEAHDAETQAAIARLRLPPYMRMFIAPAGTPHTKPRALNAALGFARGELVVIYDAEDRPEPDQLRKAAALFRTLPQDVVCLQARLAIDNVDDSWLTALFAIDYAALFDVTKAGAARLGLPVPLGGTSNHFRIDVLRRLGGWDAWNVTEDADLGLRLARHGYRVADLASTTFEEAPNRLRPWLNQRSRWLKGWMQTVISHARQPVAAFRQLGVGGFAAAVAQSLSVILGALGAPVFLTLLAARLAFGNGFGEGSALHLAADVLIVVLVAGGLATVILAAVLGMRRRGLLRLMYHLPLLPIYQFLVSVAAWKALWELLRKPYHWHKTEHGTALRRASGNPFSSAGVSRTDCRAKTPGSSR